MRNYTRGPSLQCLAWRKKNRSHFEIIASMLEALKDECTSKYSLMKHTGTNFVELKKYLESLTEMGLIEANTENGRILYKASDRGIDFLKHYYSLLGMMMSTTHAQYSWTR